MLERVVPRRRRTRALAVASLVAALAAAVLLVVRPSPPFPVRPDPVPAGGPPARTWASGAWTGGTMSAGRIEGFGRWRGVEADTVLTYPEAATWASLRDSNWHVSTFAGFPGRLVYGLPLLPRERGATLADVAAGRHDDVWRAVAASLVRNGRGDSFLRIGLEANGTWAEWGATAATAGDFRAAFRRVAGVVRAVAPDVVLVFDISCGTGLDGSDDRLAALTELYPGDDVVDVVGCDTYDSFVSRARTREEFDRMLRPDDVPGPLDVSDFARAHGKGFAVPEWGLTAVGANGSGDNPFYLRAMYEFFLGQGDHLVFENYFNEAGTDLGSGLWSRDQNPRAAAEYLRLWGRPPAASSRSRAASPAAGSSSATARR